MAATPQELASINANTQALNQILAQAESINDQTTQSPVVPTSNVIVQNGTNTPEKLTIQDIGNLGSSTPAGIEGDVQLNIGGNLGADSRINYNVTGNNLTLNAKVDIFNSELFTPYGQFDFESGDLTGFTTSGDSVWTVDNTDPGAGTFSARSGVIGDSQRSVLKLQFESTKVLNKITFLQRVSSQGNNDYLIFYIDGKEAGRWAGEIPWQGAEFYTTIGWHEYEWVYSKSSSGAIGGDLSRIDNISIQEAKLSLNTTGAELTTGKNLITGTTSIDGYLNINNDIFVNDTRLGTGDSSSNSSHTNLILVTGINRDIFTTGDQNTLFGYAVGTAITSGQLNTLMGLFSGNDVTTGSNNTFYGGRSGEKNTTGNENTAVGSFCYDKGNGNQNVAVGYTTLQNADGNKNVAIGFQVMNSATHTGTGNVAIGDRALSLITSGSHNIGIGSLAGSDITTGTGNIILDTANDFFVYGAALSNQFSVKTGNGDFKIIINEVNEATLPNSTIALINSGGVKSIATKEYADSLITGGGFLPTKSGTKSSVSFTGNPKTATISFLSAFTDVNYTPSAIGQGGDNYSITVQNITASNFEINLNSNQSPANPILWTAIKHGETP